MSEAAPVVVGANEQDVVAVNVVRWTALATQALAAEGITNGELTLTFIDEEEMAALNEEHMGEVGPTDVLSFPLDAANETSLCDSDVPVLLGDIVICPSIAEANAPDHAGTVDDELALLVIHGVLHVLGHDHATSDETAQMQSRERSLLEALHWAGTAPRTFAAHLL